MKKRYRLDLLAALCGQSVSQLLLLHGYSGTTLQQYRDLGVSERVGDRLACKVGLHPYVVWPEMLDDVARAHRSAYNARLQRHRYHSDPEWAALKRKLSARWYEENRDQVLEARRRAYHERGGAAAQRARRAAETPEQHQARLARERARRAAETPEVREARLAAARDYKRARRAASAATAR